MSDENKLQIRVYLDQLYDAMLQDISQSRGLSTNELRRIANSYAANDPETAVKLKIADQVGYRDQALQSIRDRMGLEESKKINFVSIEDYSQSISLRKGSGNDKIAIVYAEGTLVDGKGADGSIGGDSYTRILSKLRKDKNVKAIVLRVNSPGGSAMASENIWRELSLLREAGKPVIASMGDYAASGGYYIACMADSVFSEPTTLTGSIGVFSIIPSAQKMLAEKAGVRFDTVKTGRFATGITPFFDLSDEERNLLQVRTEQTYQIFLQRVADGRKMDKGKVHELAQGRVWTGSDAVTNGLSDRIGTLNEAIASAAASAGIETWRVVEYPQTKDPLQQFLDRFLEKDEPYSTMLLRKQLGDWYPYYKELENIQQSKGIQARLPFVVQIH